MGQKLNIPYLLSSHVVATDPGSTQRPPLAGAAPRRVDRSSELFQRIDIVPATQSPPHRATRWRPSEEQAEDVEAWIAGSRKSLEHLEAHRDFIASQFDSTVGDAGTVQLVRTLKTLDRAITTLRATIRTVIEWDVPPPQ